MCQFQKRQPEVIRRVCVQDIVVRGRTNSHNVRTPWNEKILVLQWSKGVFVHWLNSVHWCWNQISCRATKTIERISHRRCVRAQKHFQKHFSLRKGIPLILSRYQHECAINLYCGHKFVLSAASEYRARDCPYFIHLRTRTRYPRCTQKIRDDTHNT